MDIKTLPPMPLMRSLLFFILPMLLMMATFWGLIPLMDLMGVRLFITFLTAFGVPMLILFLLSLRFFRKEGYPWTREAFSRRFRLMRMRGTDWIWAIGVAIFFVSSQYLLSFTTVWI